MPTALFLYGPSGVGKTTLANKLVRHYSFKHVDGDVFKLIFSPKRSVERSEIAYKVAYAYAKELIERKHDIIIEALGVRQTTQLKRLLTKHKYVLAEISLRASLAYCLRNNKKKSKERRFPESVVREVYNEFLIQKGHVINVESLKEHDVFREAKAYLDCCFYTKKFRQ